MSTVTPAKKYTVTINVAGVGAPTIGENGFSDCGERGRRPGGDGMAGFARLRIRLLLLWSFPLRANGLSTPLDSGLRRNDE